MILKKSTDMVIQAARVRQQYDMFLIRSVEAQDIVRADPGRFVKALVMGGCTLAPDIHAHTFEEMKSVGDFAIFRDKALLRNLSEFYTQVQGITQWDYLRAALQTEYVRRAAGILPYSDLAQVYSAYRDNPTDFAVADAMAARARMLERRDFIDWLPAVADQRNYDIEYYENFLSKARSLRDRILMSAGATAPVGNGGVSK